MHFVVVVGVILVLGMGASQKEQPQVVEETRQSGTAKPEGAQAITAPNSNPQAVVQQPAAPRGGAIVIVVTENPQVRQATPTTRTAIQVPGGATGIAIGPEFKHHTIATRTPDGKVHVQEVTGERAARELVVPSKVPDTSSEK